MHTHTHVHVHRYAEANPPFIGIDLDISDSGREGCAGAHET
jgi:hypothetical protein